MGKQRQRSHKAFEKGSAVTEEQIRQLEERIRAIQRENQELKKKIVAFRNETLHLPQRKELRFQFIENHRSEFQVEKMCKVLKVSRSGYYKWRQTPISEQKKRKAKVCERIVHHFHNSKQRYGSPRITRMLRDEGFRISERTVSIYMKELGLRSSWRSIKGSR